MVIIPSYDPSADDYSEASIAVPLLAVGLLGALGVEVAAGETAGFVAHTVAVGVDIADAFR